MKGTEHFRERYRCIWSSVQRKMRSCEELPQPSQRRQLRVTYILDSSAAERLQRLHGRGDIRASSSTTMTRTR